MDPRDEKSIEFIPHIRCYSCGFEMGKYSWEFVQDKLNKGEFESYFSKIMKRPCCLARLRQQIVTTARARSLYNPNLISGIPKEEPTQDIIQEMKDAKVGVEAPPTIKKGKPLQAHKIKAKKAVKVSGLPSKLGTVSSRHISEFTGEEPPLPLPKSKSKVVTKKEEEKALSFKGTKISQIGGGYVIPEEFKGTENREKFSELMKYLNEVDKSDYVHGVVGPRIYTGTKKNVGYGYEVPIISGGFPTDPGAVRIVK
jgi:DNA-directed RNA polymerase subunit N (RpoN/RPB10)